MKWRAAEVTRSSHLEILKNHCSVHFLCGLDHVLTSLVTRVWAQAGEPSARCQPGLPGETWGNWCPENRTSCAKAPALWPLTCRSRWDRNRLAPVTPWGRNLSGRGGDGGGADAEPDRLPRRPGRQARDRGWEGMKAGSEAFSWPLPQTGALINLPLSSPSKDG